MDDRGFLIFILVIVGIEVLFLYVMTKRAFKLARAKGRNPVGWAVATFLLALAGAIPAWIGLIVLRLMPNQGESYHLPLSVGSSNTKRCPQCAETVKGEAKICRFCQYEFKDVI